MGVWRNWGRKPKVAKVANPTKPATRLVLQTPRRRIISMSIIGTGTRSSVRTQITTSRPERASRPRVRPEAQPQSLPSLRAMSRAISQPASSTAGVTGSRAGVRTGEEGMKTRAATPAIAVATIGSQKRPRKPITSTMGPAMTMPMPNPTAASEARMLNADWRPERNSSRAMPKHSGSTPPPMPWITRATISTSIEGATAASRDPTVRIARHTTSIRCLPTTSPTRPSRGVAMLAERRYAVNTQVTVF